MGKIYGIIVDESAKVQLGTNMHKYKSISNTKQIEKSQKCIVSMLL
jgi:hypothetical protein